MITAKEEASQLRNNQSNKKIAKLQATESIKLCQIQDTKIYFTELKTYLHTDPVFLSV